MAARAACHGRVGEVNPHRRLGAGDVARGDTVIERWWAWMVLLPLAAERRPRRLMNRPRTADHRLRKPIMIRLPVASATAW
jgi:hypothetical protein